MVGIYIFRLPCLLVLLVATNAAPTETDVEQLTNFLKKYTQYEESPRDPAESSQSGHNGGMTQEVDQTEMPAYIERVMELQKEFRQKVTGKFDPKLLEMIKQDRCGMTDAPRDPNAPAAYQVKSMWYSKQVSNDGQYHLTYSFSTDKFPQSSKIGERDIKIGVLSAMCMWEQNSNVRFTENVGDNENADITVSFGSRDHGDSYPFDGPHGTLAHAFYPENGRLHFDTDEAWYLAEGLEISGKRDIFTVAAHELGHNLGLEHSTKNEALMAPFYAFRGSFEGYELPQDDIDGMVSMYGYNNPSTPSQEEKSACKYLNDHYSITSGGSKPGNPTKTPRRVSTTRKPATTTTTTSRPEGTPKCRDDEHMGSNCQMWKDNGYCQRKGQSETMTRRCKLTCGLCSVEPSNPDTDEKNILETACAIGRFDAFTTMFDGGEYYQANAYKDGYYVSTYVRLIAKSKKKKYSLLNSTAYLGDSMVWLHDPKSVKPNTYKIDRIFDNTKNKLTAMLLTRYWYLLFDDQGKVDQYGRGTSNPMHIRKHFLKTLFEGYPHKTIDAAYVEYRMGQDKRQTVYTVFKGSKMWQYKEKDYSEMYDSANGRHSLMYIPIKDRTDIDIAEWHGVPACNVDSVFKYKDIPYFLKGNIFWPALSSEQQHGRDITYHFFRCQADRKPPTYPIPGSCHRMHGTARSAHTDGDGNSSPGISEIHFLHLILSLSLSLLVVRW